MKKKEIIKTKTNWRRGEKCVTQRSNKIMENAFVEICDNNKVECLLAIVFNGKYLLHVEGGSPWGVEKNWFLLNMISHW